MAVQATARASRPASAARVSLAASQPPAAIGSASSSGSSGSWGLIWLPSGWIVACSGSATSWKGR